MNERGGALMRFKVGALKNRINAARDAGFVHGRRRLMLTALTGAVVLALSACGTGDASTPATPANSDGRPTVVIEDLAFEPQELRIEAGDTVTWIWRDGEIAHDVSGNDFESEVISEGTFRHRFNKPGRHEYVCTLHPNMTGTIEVTSR
jgi:plastocyanin